MACLGTCTELSRKETRWHFRRPQGATVAPPAPVSGRGQREHHLLAYVQVWSDFSHPQCINQCSCPSLASLQCIAIAFWMSVFSVSFIVYSMFFMLSVKPLCSIVLLPFSAILTNLILFIFHVPNTSVLLFTVKPFCNLPLPLSAQPNLGVLCAWSNTHTVAVLHHGLYNFIVFFFFGNVWFYFILARKKNYCT